MNLGPCRREDSIVVSRVQVCHGFKQVASIFGNAAFAVAIESRINANSHRASITMQVLCAKDWRREGLAVDSGYSVRLQADPAGDQHLEGISNQVKQSGR